MATIRSKTFDLASGAVLLSVEDAVLGNTTAHTIYVTMTPNVEDAIAHILAEADAWGQKIHDGMVAAGWTPPHGS